GEDAAVAEGARPELAGVLHPADDPALGELLCDAVDHFLLREALRLEPVFRRDAEEVGGVRIRSPIRVVGDLPVRPPEVDAIGVERRAEGAAGIARRRRDVQVAEAGFAQDARVGDAVQGDASAEAERVEARLPLQPAGEVDEDLLEHELHAGGDVGMTLPLRRLWIDRSPRIPWRTQLGLELARPALARA